MANKGDLVKSLYKKCHNISMEDVKYMLEVTSEYMQEQLSDGNRIELRGFGSFSIRRRKYAKKDKQYNTIYYRVSSKILKDLNHEKNIRP